MGEDDGRPGSGSCLGGWVGAWVPGDVAWIVSPPGDSGFNGRVYGLAYAALVDVGVWGDKTESRVDDGLGDARVGGLHVGEPLLLVRGGE